MLFLINDLLALPLSLLLLEGAPLSERRQKARLSVCFSKTEPTMLLLINDLLALPPPFLFLQRTVRLTRCAASLLQSLKNRTHNIVCYQRHTSFALGPIFSFYSRPPCLRSTTGTAFSSGRPQKPNPQCLFLSINYSLSLVLLSHICCSGHSALGQFLPFGEVNSPLHTIQTVTPLFFRMLDILTLEA